MIRDGGDATQNKVKRTQNGNGGNPSEIEQDSMRIHPGKNEAIIIRASLTSTADCEAAALVTQVSEELCKE